MARFRPFALGIVPKPAREMPGATSSRRYRRREAFMPQRCGIGDRAEVKYAICDDERRDP